VQGKAAVFKVTGASGMKLGGTLLDHTIHFFEDKDGGYVGLQGVHALTPPGLYTLTMTGTLPIESPYFGAAFNFSQAVLVRSGNYPFDPVLTVSPETIDPAVTGPEDAEWAALAAPVTPEKLWDGQFTSPAPEPFSQCWPSRFGNRRSYNGSAYVYFHSGLDFCGGVGVEIHAPAAGIVVFASPLTVRGNATIINHGWGVYTAYLHQSEFLIHVGDTVTQGQVIGLVGGTGRVTGPHLHWEVWAGDVQVDPLDWLNQIFP
jgi:murein DD-endopeptidase MepM/ murein hydrolase activator NlpD